MKSYYDLTAEERHKVADFLSLLGCGGVIGIAVRHYAQQERSLARLSERPEAPAEIEQAEAFQWPL